MLKPWDARFEELRLNITRGARSIVAFVRQTIARARGTLAATARILRHRFAVVKKRTVPAYKRIKPPIVSLISWMGFSGVVLTTLVVFVLVKAWHPVILIEPFSVPEAAYGYNSEALSRRTVDELLELYRRAQNAKWSVGTGQQFEIGSSIKIPDLKVGETGVSLQALIEIVQDLPFIPSVRVSGEVVQAYGASSDPLGKPTQITLRILNHGDVLMWDRLRLSSSDLDASAVAISRRIVQEIDPGVFAASLLDDPDSKREQVLEFTERVQRDPTKYQSGIIGAATALLKLHLLNEAEVLLKKAIELSPRDPTVHQVYGRFLQQQPERCTEAVKELLAYVALAPKTQATESRLELGRAMECAGNTAGAILEYRRAFKASDSLNFPNYLSRVLEGQKESDKALSLLDKEYIKRLEGHIKRNPTDPGGYMARGDHLISKEEWHDAEGAFWQAIELDRGRGRFGYLPYEKLAYAIRKGPAYDCTPRPPTRSALSCQKPSPPASTNAEPSPAAAVDEVVIKPEHKTIREVWEEAIKALPSHQEPYEELAKMYECDCDLTSAEAVYRSMLRAIPGQAAASRRFALFLNSHSRRDDGIRVLQNTYGAPDAVTSGSVGILADWLWEGRHYDEAARAYQRAGAMLELATAWLSRGEIDKALIAYRQAPKDSYLDRAAAASFALKAADALAEQHRIDDAVSILRDNLYYEPGFEANKKKLECYLAIKDGKANACEIPPQQAGPPVHTFRSRGRASRQVNE